MRSALYNFLDIDFQRNIAVTTIMEGRSGQYAYRYKHTLMVMQIYNKQYAKRYMLIREIIENLDLL